MSFLMLAMLGCSSKDESEFISIYKGQVVYSSNNLPFPNVHLKITDGKNIHTQGQTDQEGRFALYVNISQINNDYYLLIEDDNCSPKKVALTGFGQKEIDLKVIPVDGPSTPIIGDVSVTEVLSNKIQLLVQVSDDGKEEVTARGVCYSKHEIPTLDDEFTLNGTGTGFFNVAISNLNASTTYYVRAYATNAMGTSYSNQIVVSTTNGQPVLNGLNIIAQGETSVICYSEIESDGGFSLKGCGVCWSTHQNPTTYDMHTIETPKIGMYSSVVNNLSANTTYYFRAYATNSEGTAYSEEKAYEIGSTDIQISIGQVTLSRADQITCNCNITSDGGFAITKRGVCWSTKQNPTIADNHTVDGNGIGSYQSTLSNLPCGALIYLRAYATNMAGTEYSEQKSIMTGSGYPTIISTTVSSISSYSASLSAKITDDGGLPVLARGFCWTIMPLAIFCTLEEADGYSTNGAGVGAFSGTATPLSPNYTYYARAYVTNVAGTFYGDMISFKTKAN